MKYNIFTKAVHYCLTSEMSWQLARGQRGMKLKWCRTSDPRFKGLQGCIEHQQPMEGAMELYQFHAASLPFALPPKLPTVAGFVGDSWFDIWAATGERLRAREKGRHWHSVDKENDLGSDACPSNGDLIFSCDKTTNIVLCHTRFERGQCCITNLYKITWTTASKISTEEDMYGRSFSKASAL